MDDQINMLGGYAAVAVLDMMKSQETVTKKDVKGVIMRAFSAPMARLEAFESWKRRIEEAGDDEGWAAAWMYWREACALSEARQKAVNALIEATKQIGVLEDQAELASFRRQQTQLENDNLKVALASLGQNKFSSGVKAVSISQQLAEATAEVERLKLQIAELTKVPTNVPPTI